MRKKLIHVALGLFVAGVFCLAGCGEGGSGSTETNLPLTPTGTEVSLTTFNGFFTGTAATGSQMSFTITGSDTLGWAYSGSIAFVSDGITTFEGQTVTQVRIISTLTRTATGASSTGFVTEYFLVSDGNLYKQVNSLGETGVPSSQTPLADSARVGDFGNLWNITNSDGTSDTCTWKLDADFNNNSKLIISFVSKNLSDVVIRLEENTFYLDGTGNPYKYAVKITSNGQSLRMSGKRNE